MHRNTHRFLLAAAAALLLVGAARADQTAPPTRAQLRAELAEARALGARLALAQRAQAVVPLPQQQRAYVEAGRDGPVLVLVDIGEDGTVHCVEGPLAQVAIDDD